MADTDGYYGTQQPNSASDEYNAMAFIIRQILNERHYVALVKVVNVTAAGGLALSGTVDVVPLINQLDGQGNAIPHGTVNDLPYVRIQGGSNAVIIDPVVGDIGLCVFCDRDISAVCNTKKASNPGSMRRSDMADGVYLGGLLNAIPTQYAMFTPAGIELHSPTLIKLTAPKVQIIAPLVEINASTSTVITTPDFTVNGKTHLNGNTDVTGTTTLNGAVTASSTINAGGTVTAPTVAGTSDVTFAGKSSATHKHTGVTVGTGQTGTPA